MPITLLSRRQFLIASAAVGASLATRRLLHAQDAVADPNRFALISDSHINADAAKLDKDVNMADHLKLVVAAIAALSPKPAAVIHGGDVAHIKGDAGDYATLGPILKRLLDQGTPLHLALGNHDDRTNFTAAMPATSAVDQKHVARVESPLADWYLLDSLDKPNATPGVLGEKQLAWLAKSLDARPDKNAVVLAHHHPIDQPRKFPGLNDTRQLLDVILPRRQVKLLLYGHTHDYAVFPSDAPGLHRINLPPTAYVFEKGRPAGWVDCSLTPTGGTFKLMALDTKHPQHGHTTTLKWR